MMSNIRAARATAIAMIEAVKVPTFNDMVDVLQSKRDILLNLDPTFVLELNFLASAGLRSLEKKLHKMILKALPSNSHRVTLQQARRVLSNGRRSESAKG